MRTTAAQSRTSPWWTNIMSSSVPNVSEKATDEPYTVSITCTDAEGNSSQKESRDNGPA